MIHDGTAQRFIGMTNGATAKISRKGQMIEVADSVFEQLAIITDVKLSLEINFAEIHPIEHLIALGQVASSISTSTSGSDVIDLIKLDKNIASVNPLQILYESPRATNLLLSEFLYLAKAYFFGDLEHVFKKDVRGYTISAYATFKKGSASNGINVGTVLGTTFQESSAALIPSGLVSLLNSVTFDGIGFWAKERGTSESIS
jgi:hypothetical protein